MTLTVGLTGGIGSGKSTVSDMFAQQGSRIIDTDVITHKITQANGAGITPIQDTFGTAYFNADGSLNRRKMRDRIFSDPNAKQQLEAILHPLILRQCQTELQKLQSEPYVIIVIPLLAETPEFQKIVQRILLVDCKEATQIERVMQRSHLTTEQVRTIVAQQAPRAQRQTLADDLIFNESNLTNLTAEVAILNQLYIKIDSDSRFYADPLPKD